jgi:hypothetical protein
MIGPELTVPGVPQVELPVSSKTTMLLYEMDIRYRVCLNGQEKLPGAQWANGDRVRDLAVADGKVSGIEQGPYHCLLVAGLGCLPPLFQHWYSALASAVRVTLTPLTPVPRPASWRQPSGATTADARVGVEEVRAVGQDRRRAQDELGDYASTTLKRLRIGNSLLVVRNGPFDWPHLPVFRSSPPEKQQLIPAHFPIGPLPSVRQIPRTGLA